MNGGAVGKRIRATRKAKGWSLDQLAVYADLSVKTVWLAEKGQASRKTLRLIGDTLDLDLFEEAAS